MKVYQNLRKHLVVITGENKDTRNNQEAVAPNALAMRCLESLGLARAV